MGKIIILDENTSNMIAAGEVVERPASVVKELIENSIDAGADNISIEIKNGGISYIKIADNGTGIDEDDIEIAFERHSTSKIKSSEDLESISTLGFRGEALASIAAVSHVQLTTRTRNRPYGMYFEIRGGRIIEAKQTGCPTGTTFVVRDLFFNTPARYKFLKKDSTESGYVSDIITRIALGNPHISFRFTSNGSGIIHTPGNNDLLSVIFSIYGRETAKEIIAVDYQDNSIKITGYAGKPGIARANRNHQSIFVNGRYVKSKIIISAVDEAYKTFLMKNKYAFVVLKIETNPLLIDVNVHPAKMEIRFSNEQDIFRSVYHAVNNALLGRTDGTAADILKKSEETFKFRNKLDELENNKAEQKLNDRYNKANECINEAESDYRGEAEEIQEENRFEDAKIIGQIFSTYIILQWGDRVLLMDQHAAHERINYEKMKMNYSNNEPIAQVLLTPVVLELTPSELRFLNENGAFFNRMGFTFEVFGNNSIILRSVPCKETGSDIKAVFLEVLDFAESSGNKDFNMIADEALYTIACKAAVKANTKLDSVEIRNLLKELSKLENPYTCPHGRPTVIEITKHELERMFKRIV